MAIQPFNLQKNLIVNASGNLMCIDARQPFTFKIDTTKGNGFTSFQFPLRTGYTYNFNYQVNNGTIVTVNAYNSPNALISFPSAGVYEIKVRGYVGSWYDYNTGDVQKYIEVSKFGDCEFGDVAGMFYGAVNLKITCNEGPFAPKATRADSMYRNSGITSVPEQTFYRMQNVVNLSSAISDCVSLITPVTTILFKYNTRVVYLNKCLSNNANLPGGIPFGFFDTNISVITLEQFAFNCPKMNGTVDAQLTSKLVNLNNIGYLFANNPLLNIALTEDSFINNPKITNTTHAYYCCYKATGTIPTLRYMPNLVDIRRAFFATRNLSIPPVLFDLSTVNKINDWRDFAFCADTIIYSHTGTLQDFWNYANPASLHTGVFLNCTAITNYSTLRSVWPT